jgi:hypothetical protein
LKKKKKNRKETRKLAIEQSGAERKEEKKTKLK